MIKTVHIKELSDLSDIIYEQSYQADLDRYRSPYLYRGLSNSSYTLVTSLQRNCKHKKDMIEKAILRNFTKYAINDDPMLEESVWRQLVIGQHHGLPTRLLDWTYSPLVGLHFATSEENMAGMDGHDAVLWRIDIQELNSLLPLEYRQKLDSERAFLFTIDMLKSMADSLDDYDQHMEKNSIVLIEPPSIDQRIINQYSYFSVIPKEIKDIEEFLEVNTSNTVKYTIDKSLKWRIRDMLDQMNINERIAYPGLDGLTRWIKRHYYVK